MGIQWLPQIGDPTPVGWLTVGAYLLASAISLRTYVGTRAGSEARFWFSISIAFLALAINKQLDLQTLLTEIMRALAKYQGWYEQRRAYQIAFISIVSAFSALSTARILWVYRNSGYPIKLALSGMILILLFIVVRAASFHRIDVILNDPVMGIRSNWVIELTGIFIVGLAAALQQKPK